MFVKIVRLLFLLLFFNFYVCYCYAESILTEKEELKRLNDKISYAIAEEYFNEGNSLFSKYLFIKLIKNNELYNKYSYKSKLYLALSKFKRGKLNRTRKACKSILSVKYMLNQKSLNCVRYLKAKVFVAPGKNFLFNINRYKADQTFVKKAFRCLSKMDTKTVHTSYRSLVNDTIYKVEVRVKRNRLYIANYYFKKGYYISVIKRLHHFNHSCKDEYDAQSNYLLIKSYNELYLSDISEKLLNFEPSKYFKQRTKKIT